MKTDAKQTRAAERPLQVHRVVGPAFEAVNEDAMYLAGISFEEYRLA